MSDPTTELTRRAAAELFVDRPPRPPFDPELAGPAEEFGALPTAIDLGVAEYRSFIKAAFADFELSDLTFGGKVKVEHRRVPGPEGAPDVGISIFTPVSGAGPRPLIYNVHSGGMITGDAVMDVAPLLEYVADGSAVVVSVDYRLAPEHPDPAPVEDCYAALVWATDHAEELGVDRNRVIAFGMSAGGGLTAGIALMARDRRGPSISHQVLMCPMLDDRIQTVSSRMSHDGPWASLENLWGWTALLGARRGGPNVSPYAAPARAEDLSGLPRTYIDTGSSEVFRDEILVYARRLSEAGVVVDLHMWGGGFHGFDMIPAAISTASKAVRDEFLRRALAP